MDEPVGTVVLRNTVGDRAGGRSQPVLVTPHGGVLSLSDLVFWSSFTGGAGADLATGRGIDRIELPGLSAGRYRVGQMGGLRLRALYERLCGRAQRERRRRERAGAWGSVGVRGRPGVRFRRAGSESSVGPLISGASSRFSAGGPPAKLVPSASLQSQRNASGFRHRRSWRRSPGPSVLWILPAALRAPGPPCAARRPGPRRPPPRPGPPPPPARGCGAAASPR